MRSFTGVIALALVLVPLAGVAGQSGITINRALAGETHKGARAAAGYMMITNTGDQADRLLRIEADFDRVMLHTTEMTDSVATMVHLPDGVAIAPGASLMMVPGGMHVMFMGLGGDGFRAGAEIPAVAVFERAGRVAVTFQVVPLTALGDIGQRQESHDSHTGN